MLKKHSRADADIRGFEKELAKCQLFDLGDSMQEKPPGIPDLWKFRISLKSENLGARKGLRLIAERRADALLAIALYTHSEYESQPPWPDIRSWIADATTA